MRKSLPNGIRCGANIFRVEKCDFSLSTIAGISLCVECVLEEQFSTFRFSAVDSTGDRLKAKARRREIAVGERVATELRV